MVKLELELELEKMAHARVCKIHLDQDAVGPRKKKAGAASAYLGCRSDSRGGVPSRQSELVPWTTGSITKRLTWPPPSYQLTHQACITCD